MRARAPTRTISNTWKRWEKVWWKQKRRISTSSPITRIAFFRLTQETNTCTAIVPEESFDRPRTPSATPGSHKHGECRHVDYHPKYEFHREVHLSSGDYCPPAYRHTRTMFHYPPEASTRRTRSHCITTRPTKIEMVPDGRGTGFDSFKSSYTNLWDIDKNDKLINFRNYWKNLEN